MTGSNVGKWSKFYADAKTPQHYGNSESYRIGGEWLTHCDTVEDWGCGLGWFRQFVAGRYVGVDGSWSRFADEVDDLETRRSSTPGLFMRHVLEHNDKWRHVLANALASFTERMVLVLFTPWVAETVKLRHEDGYGVPTIGFKQSDIEDELGNVGEWGLRTIESPETFYGVEHVYLIER